MPEEDPSQRYTANLQGEVDGASLYRTLSQTEKNPELAQVYARLGAVEEAHAEFWKRKMERSASGCPACGRASGRGHSPGWRAASVRHSSCRRINTLEQLDSGTYDTQPEAVAGGLPAAERSHARIMEALAAPSPGGSRRDDRAAGGPPPRPGRQRAAGRRARRQ